MKGGGAVSGKVSVRCSESYTDLKFCLVFIVLLAKFIKFFLN